MTTTHCAGCGYTVDRVDRDEHAGCRDEPETAAERRARLTARTAARRAVAARRLVAR